LFKNEEIPSLLSKYIAFLITFNMAPLE